MKKSYTMFGTLVLLALLQYALPMQSRAALKLLDDKLRVKGSLYEFATYRTSATSTDRQYSDTRFGLMRTKATLELLYEAVQNDKMMLNLFGFFQYWHESVPDFDDEYRQSIASWNRKKYQGPSYDADDWINELYVDLYKGKWNLRLGKQIVFWSEVDMVRTIDRINPLDLRYTTPGIDPFDEMKLGLWMMRGFYNSDLPGQLNFEWIWIPGDFEGIRTPVEGTALGATPAPQGPENLRPRPFGQGAVVEREFYRSKPAWTLGNSEYAFRVRGNSELPLLGDVYLLDWTLSWFHGMNQTPVARRKNLGEPSLTNMDPSTLNGYLSANAVSRVFGLPAPRLPHSPFWRYKFFDAIGASLQSYIPAVKGVLRGEFSYEIGLPENMAVTKSVDRTPGSQKPITGTTERDNFNTGITLDRPIQWRWLENRWGSSGVFDCTFGWFGQWRLGNVTRIRRTFGYYQRSQSNFTVLIRGKLWNNELWPTLRFLYNTRNWGYGALALRYTPGKHMRYEGGYLWFFAKDPADSTEASAENKDLIYLRVGYEF